jgi:uracil-DNA glycosylase family 4
MSQKKWCKKTDCPYFNRVEVPYAGDINADILVVGESPGREEILRQQPFVGMSGQVLNAVLDSIGYSRSTVCIANACRCLINKDQDSIKDVNLALTKCRPKLTRIIEQVKPKVIVALGAVALKQLTGKQKIMENRGRFFYSEEFGCQIFCTVHPAYVLRGASREFWNKTASKRTMKENLLFIDFSQVKKFLEENKVDQLDTSQYREGTKWDLNKMQRDAKVVAVDFETTGLDLFNPEVRCLSVSFCAEEGRPLVFFADEEGQFIPEVRKILEDPHITKLVASRPFEERICRQKLGFEMQGQIHDVLVMAHLLDENYHSYGLEAVADIYTPLKGIKSLAQGMRASLEELSKADLLKYNAVDADATLRAFRVMSKMFKADEQLLRYYAYFMQKIQDMFTDLYFNGGMIDADQLRTDEQALETIIQSLHSQCLAMIPQSIKDAHEGKLQLSRPLLVQDYLFLHKDGLRLRPDPHYLTPKTKKPQCSEDHLRQFEGVPFIALYLRMKKAEKILSTYISQIWQVMKPDGRIYPSTLFTQTVTGRTVMKEPTIQTIPQRGEFAPYVKRAFVSDKGWLFGARDLGQSEIRIMGWLAKDPNILGALNKNIDIHTKTASIVNGVPVDVVKKDQRQKAKGINFGFIYGMGSYKFKFYAKAEYGVEYTEEEAAALRAAFFAYPNGYYKLPEYYKQQEALVCRDGFIRSKLGRIRRLPGAQSFDENERREAFRQAINMPVQSFSSDLGLIGMYLFWQELKKRPVLAKNVKIMWFIHDAIYFQAKEKYFGQAMRLLKHCLEVESKKYVKEKFGVEIGYPITSDGKQGVSWATMHDWKEEE